MGPLNVHSTGNGSSSQSPWFDSKSDKRQKDMMFHDFVVQKPDKKVRVAYSHHIDEVVSVATV